MLGSVEAPCVHLVLRAHPPAPARISLVHRPLAWRVVGVVLSLGVCWTAAPWLFWVPPHYPWPVLAFLLGAWLAYRSSRAFRVRWFAGACPRCGRPLRLKPGAYVSLPYRFTCFACHFEPELHAYHLSEEERFAREAGRGIRHVTPECPGTWAEEVLWDQPFLSCSRCGARHHATDALRRAAAEENPRGALLELLAAEGKFLT
ncbi:MAG TPA: hypothetical protein VFX98_08820 [Longimicrobiaceae bacterium]|nr:hypothetical protein [Longimicrobiaceae bacterium]